MSLKALSMDVRDGLTASTEACADTVHALLRVDLVDNNKAALVYALLRVSRRVQVDLRTEARCGCDRGYGKCMSVYDYRLARPS